MNSDAGLQGSGQGFESGGGVYGLLPFLTRRLGFDIILILFEPLVAYEKCGFRCIGLRRAPVKPSLSR